MNLKKAKPRKSKNSNHKGGAGGAAIQQQRKDAMVHHVLAEHPDLKREDPAEQDDAIKEFLALQRIYRQQKQRDHLETLGDGIIAVIITIMLLEIPLPGAEGSGTSYGIFLKSVGIFLVSFFVVADFWYEHHKIYADVERVSKPVIVVDFIFLAVLSLIPLLTKWMMVETSFFTILHYGIAYLLSMTALGILMQAIRKAEHEKAEIDLSHEKMMRRFSWARNIGVLFMCAVLVTISIWSPYAAVIFFLVMPIGSFVLEALSDRDDADELMRSMEA